MTDQSNVRTDVLDEITNKTKLGDKKFHSETSLQNLNEDDVEQDLHIKDPGVVNQPLNDENVERRRTMSQPGPVSGNLVTATAARAARKRPQRNVAYASDNEQIPRIILVRDDSTTNSLNGDNNTTSYLNGNLRNGDLKSLNSYRIYTSVNDLRGVGTPPPHKRSVATLDAQSLRSIETHAPPATDPVENKKLTIKYLTLVLSCIYTTILVTLGVIVYIASAVLRSGVATYFSIALCTIGMLYHIYLVVDIGRYKSTALKNQKIKSKYDEKLSEYFNKQENYNNDEYTPGDKTPVPVPPPMLIPLKHDYCFSTGRHSGSFYLKMGAAAFALGHLIHSVLLVAMQVGQLVDEDVDNDECVSISQVTLDVLSPCYSFLQLYFIFKYSNVIILKRQGLAHVAIMHVIGSSICAWLSAIVRETVLALTLYANLSYGNNNTDYDNGDDYANGAVNRFLDISGLYNQHCAGSTSLTNVSQNFSPYLYPFSVEFNILIVAIYYIIWSQVGHCENVDSNASEANSNSEDNATVCKIPTAHEDNDFTSNLVIHADCHASNRGLFIGLILMVVTAGMLIIGYIFSSVGGDFAKIGYLLNDSTLLGLHSVLLLSAVVAFNQLRKLDINEHPISLLDDVLLFICLPAFALETTLSLVATINVLNVVKITNYVVMALQVLVQTPLIMDGLRRCSNNKKLRKTKPGRELLMFLIIANVAMWLFYTFSYKSPERFDERYVYYGKPLWSILGHLSLPLIMFYRFHSSVCFADIWDSAYKPGSEH